MACEAALEQLMLGHINVNLPASSLSACGLTRWNREDASVLENQQCGRLEKVQRDWSQLNPPELEL